MAAGKSLNRPRRRCRIWYCKTVSTALCCADCWMFGECAERCLNWPSRCGCVAKGWDRGAQPPKEDTQ